MNKKFKLSRSELMRNAAVFCIVVGQFIGCPPAHATKCFEDAQGFHLAAGLLPGLKGTSYFLRISCGGHAALVVKPFGKKAVRKEWHYSIGQFRSIMDAIDRSAFYELPLEIGESPPIPDSGSYMLSAHRDLEGHRVFYYPGFKLSSPEKSRFLLVWNAAFAPTGSSPPVP